MIEIVEPGPFASIQDAGRSGFARLGVARSGAFDRAALRLANRLVGNRPDSAAVEVTLGGLELRVHDAVTLALAGAVPLAYAVIARRRRAVAATSAAESDPTPPDESS